MDLAEKIKTLVPGAEYVESGDGLWKIPSEKLHDFAKALKDELHFDFLRSLTGTDCGEEGFGVVYHVEATDSGRQIVFKSVTPGREKCELPTVSDIWKAAEMNEREVYDYFGVEFLNHPDMRRLYLRDDWEGYPLRKDYDMDKTREINPIRMNNEVASDDSPSYELDERGNFIRKTQGTETSAFS